MSLRCLVVDDSGRFLAAARALLEREGVAVVGVASSVAEAVRLAEELEPDVILLDINLGTDSGFDLARRLAERDRPGQPAAERTKIILISSHAEDDFEELIAASPALGFLDKATLSARAIQRLLPAGDTGTNGAPGR
jgi:two-component system, NarL family, nitrate/nitrite response regulator NarL